MYAHFDADYFFAAVELLKQPELRGKPVMVCSRTDNRGIVLSATYEARTFGIRAGTPVFKAKKLCLAAHFLPSHFGEYTRISRHFMDILRNFSPEVEVNSIDEAFVDLVGLEALYHTDEAGIAKKMQTEIFEKLGITVSVGLAQTKTLAKIASDFKKPARLTIVTSKTREDFLQRIPIKNIPGVGPATEVLLQQWNIQTAADFAQAPFEKIQKILGKHGEFLHRELNGIVQSKIALTGNLPKSLSATRTFDTFSNDKNRIFAFSLKLLLSLTERLRSYGLSAQVFEFFIMAKNFKTFSLKKRLETQTCEDKIFIEVFKQFFEECWRGIGHAEKKPPPLLRRAGFYLNHLAPSGPRQASLFENTQSRPERHGLDAAIDKINKKFGKKGITRGALL